MQEQAIASTAIKVYIMVYLSALAVFVSQKIGHFSEILALFNS